MSPTLPFALYLKPAPTQADRVNEGFEIRLDSPVGTNDQRVFRRSLWLPLPEICRSAEALHLDGSKLTVAFKPAEFEVQTWDRNWFSRAEDLNSERARLELLWPATVTRISPTASGRRAPFRLYRTDGDAVSAEPTQRGYSGDSLDPPWKGSPFVVAFDFPPAATVAGQGLSYPSELPHGASVQVLGANTAHQAVAVPHEVPVVASSASSAFPDVSALLTMISTLVPGIGIAAHPVSPRLRLLLEGGGEGESDRLLWQTLQPGEHHQTVTLPGGDRLALEWQPALEQLLRFCQQLPQTDSLPRLRLDIEADGPCLVKLSQIALKLHADHALVSSPLRFDFDGQQFTRRKLELGPVPTGTPQQLMLKGRLQAADTPAADELPAAASGSGRRGVLLEQDQRLCWHCTLAAPATLAGFRFDWHPLSAQLVGMIRVLPGHASRGGSALIEQTFSFDTSQPHDRTSQPQRLLVRWPAFDAALPALRLQFILHEGRGIWLASAGGQGWRLHLQPDDVEGQALDLELHADWLQVAPPAPTTPDHEPEISLGKQILPYSRRTQAHFEVLITSPALDSWPEQELSIASGVAARLVIESAILRSTLP